MTSIWRNPWILILLVLGTYQFGSGLWIFVKAHFAQYLIAQAWHQTLEDKQRHRPWSWADTYPVAQLSIMQQSWYVLADANARNLAFGPTHFSATPLPGELGNSVIVGHRDTQFNSLKTLKTGDTIEVTTLQGTSRYQVRSLSIILARQLGEWSANEAEEGIYSALTLVTCYPFDSLKPNPSHRYVVSAVKI